MADEPTLEPMIRLCDGNVHFGRQKIPTKHSKGGHELLLGKFEKAVMT